MFTHVPPPVCPERLCEALTNSAAEGFVMLRVMILALIYLALVGVFVENMRAQNVIQAIMWPLLFAIVLFAAQMAQISFLASVMASAVSTGLIWLLVRFLALVVDNLPQGARE